MLNLRKVMLILLVLPFVFFLNLSGAMGQEGCIVPTIPKNVEGIETYLALQWNPTNPKTIDRNSEVTISVIGGFAPYSWSVSGNGFTLGVSKTTGLQNTLYADDNACGAATVTVTDASGVTATGFVRSENGQWYLVESEQCSHWERGWCAYCTCVDTFEIGAYRYENVWIGDKACQMTEESCGPYGGGEDLRGNACYVVGYYTPAYCGTFFGRSMWEWRCPP